MQVVLKESAPGLGRRLPVANETLADAGLPDVDAESATRHQCAALASLDSLLMRMRSRPSRGTAGRPWLASPDLPRPEEAQPVAGSGTNCFGLDDDQRRTPVRRHARQLDPKESVGCVQMRALLRGALKKGCDAAGQRSPTAAQCGVSGRMRLRRGRVRAIRIKSEDFADEVQPHDFSRSRLARRTVSPVEHLPRNGRFDM